MTRPLTLRPGALERRFAATVVAVIFLASTVLFGLYVSLSVLKDFDALSRQSEQLADRQAALMAEWLWNLDRARVERALAAMVRHDIVASARVRDETDAVFAEAVAAASGIGDLTLSRPIRFRTDASVEDIGELELVITNAPLIDRMLSRLITHGFLALLLTLAAAVAAIVAHRRIVGAPLRRMLDSMEATDGVEIPRPIEWNSADEIGAVVASFNRMMARRRRAILKQEILARDLHEAQKMEAIGQLAGGIAHELNTPLQYVSDNLEFLSESVRDLLELERCCTDTLRQAREPEVQAMLNALKDRCKAIDLDFLKDEIPAALDQSRSGVEEVSKIVVAMKEFSQPNHKALGFADINRALENTVAVSSNQWRPHAAIELHCDPDLPPVPGLHNELNQVFLNLIVNAAQAISACHADAETGRIRVSTRRVGRTAVIEIADNGIGMPPDIQGRIFEPFFTTREVGKGIGQGLAVSHDIVVGKHHGKISFDTVEGRGTTFVVMLPLRHAQSGEAVPAAA